MCQSYFFAGARLRSSSNQFVTVTNVVVGCEALGGRSTRKRPSGATSHVVPARPVFSTLTGTPTDKPGVVEIVADHNASRLEESQKNNWRPSCDQRGMRPRSVETRVTPPGPGNGMR